MAQNKIVGYKKIFGFVLPDWVDESMIRQIVFFLLTIAVMFFVLIFLVWPKFADITKLKGDLKQKQENLTTLKNSETSLNQLNDQVSESQQTVILSAIPQAYSPENAIFILRKIADDTGVSILSYKIPAGVLYQSDETMTKSTKNGDMVKFENFPIKLSVAAPVASLLKFIDQVENSLPFGIVSDLGIQEVAKLSNSVSKSVQMDLEVKYYKASLGLVDITKIKTLTADDLSWAAKLAGYRNLGNVVAIPSGETVMEPTGSSGNLFGM